MSQALYFKEQGNRHFQKGDYLGAESLYSQAIIADPKNQNLYTNRAFARLKLDQWDSVIADCQTVLDLPLGRTNIKAHHYLCQAHFNLGDYDAALAAGLLAHEHCVATNDRSLGIVTDAVLRCKRARWEHNERRRVREDQELERVVMRLLLDERAADVKAALADGGGGAAEAEAVEQDYRAREERLMAVFERSRKFGGDAKREVPDWAVCDISFRFMLDPVMTKSGKSYDRASIWQFLRLNPIDPVTREPLLPSELRPNLALRQACEDFLKENGWAADY